jgi:hypothetical protein
MPRGAKSITGALIQCLDRAPDNLALRIVPLLARAGDRAARRALQRLSNEPNSDISAAAREALT